MVDVVSIIIAVVAAIIAVVALILIFVLPGSQGATGPTGTSSLTGFAKIVGNGVGSSISVEATTIPFTPTLAVTVRMLYSNITDLFNMVYTASNGSFTVASGGNGYYQIHAENLVKVNLTSSDTGSTTLYMDLMVNGVSLAQSTTRVFFESGSQTSLLMFAVDWQGSLNAGDSVAINLTIDSSYSGTMSYGFKNNTRLMLNGITKYS